MSREFGNRILNLLQKQNLTQKELAKMIKTTEATLSHYVRGDREPKANMIAKISIALNTTSDYLLGLERETFDFPKVERALARYSSTMTDKEKKAIISALFQD